MVCPGRYSSGTARPRLCTQLETSTFSMGGVRFVLYSAGARSHYNPSNYNDLILSRTSPGLQVTRPMCKLKRSSSSLISSFESVFSCPGVSLPVSNTRALLDKSVLSDLGYVEAHCWTHISIHNRNTRRQYCENAWLTFGCFWSQRSRLCSQLNIVPVTLLANHTFLHQTRSARCTRTITPPWF